MFVLSTFKLGISMFHMIILFQGRRISCRSLHLYFIGCVCWKFSIITWWRCFNRYNNNMYKTLILYKRVIISQTFSHFFTTYLLLRLTRKYIVWLRYCSDHFIMNLKLKCLLSCMFSIFPKLLCLYPIWLQLDYILFFNVYHLGFFFSE